jgi:hypothetical protein
MIIGLNFNKVLIEKSKNPEKLKVSKVNTKASLPTLEEEKIEVPEKKAFRVTFSFSIDYEPNLAKLLIEGSILSLGDEKEVQEILESWKKKKDINIKTRTEILNYVLMKCNLKALSLEDEFNLPPHIPMPRVQEKTTSPTTSSSSDISKTDYAG